MNLLKPMSSPPPAAAPPAVAPPLVPKPPVLAYIMSLVVVTMVGVVAVLAIELLRPDKDNSQLITTLLGMLTPTAGVIIVAIQNSYHSAALREVHFNLNSRLDQLVSAKEQVAKAAGVEEGRLAVDIPVQVAVQPPPDLPKQKSS